MYWIDKYMEFINGIYFKILLYFVMLLYYIYLMNFVLFDIQQKENESSVMELNNNVLRYIQLFINVLYMFVFMIGSVSLIFRK